MPFALTEMLSETLDGLRGLVGGSLGRAPNGGESSGDVRSPPAGSDRYRLLFEESAAGVFRIAADGTILQFNRALARMHGFDDPAELEGRSVLDFYASPADREERMRRLREHGSITNHELELRRRDGSTLWMLESSTLLRDPETGEEVVVGTAIDITERRRLQGELERMAYQDLLTGLANRHQLRDQAARTLARADRRSGRVALLYLNLIRFKRINDSLGHVAGDQVLRQIADRLRGLVREGDMVARVGGDEFAVVLADVEEVGDAVRAAWRVQDLFREPFATESGAFHLTARLGIAVYPDHARDVDDLLSNADRASTRVKGDGTEISIFRGPASPMGSEDLLMEESFRRGLEDEEFTLFYQPIFRRSRDGGDVELAGVEALARWRHPDRGLLPAAAFIGLAERTGLVRKLDRWCLRRAVRRARRWRDEPGGPEWVAVNLSPWTFEHPHLSSYVAGLLEEAGLEGRRLSLEVTERVAMRDPAATARTLESLRELGVRLSLDDFGKGQSSLAYLRHFPADTLKVDRSFIDRLGDDPKHERLVRGILALASGLEMRVIAEGVETAVQRDWLRAAGCDLMQGYLLGRPVPAEQLRQPA